MDWKEEIIKLDDEKYKNKRRTRLDGEATTALAQLQIKYKNRIKEVLEEFDQEEGGK
jgi:hypothetical protein